MQSYKSIIGANSTLVLSTRSDLFKFLEGMTPDGNHVPIQRSANKHDHAGMYAVTCLRKLLRTVETCLESGA